jgi:D-threo-aldose 1-dehydrogenase
MTVVGPAERRPFGHSEVRLSALGIGAGTLSNGEGAEAFAHMLEHAWQAGLRSFDSAPLYLDGGSERRLGEFLATKPRSEFTVSTKVGRLPNGANHGGAPERRFDYSSGAVERSIAESLERLGVDVLDIVYVHDVDRRMHGADFDDVLRAVLDESLPMLQSLRAQGVIRAIGLSSRQPDVCLAVAEEAPIDGFMMAGAYTLLNHEPFFELLPYCLDRGLSVLVASPFNTGILATGSADSTFDYGQASPEVAARVAQIAALCEHFGVSLPGVALRYPLLHPAVTGVVVGNRNADELQANLRALAQKAPLAFWRRLVNDDLLPPGSVPTGEDALRAL